MEAITQWKIGFIFAIFFLGMAICRLVVNYLKRRMDESRSIVIRFPRRLKYSDFYGLAPRFRGLMREEQFKKCSLEIGGRWIPIWSYPPLTRSAPPTPPPPQPPTTKSQGEL